MISTNSRLRQWAHFFWLLAAIALVIVTHRLQVHIDTIWVMIRR